MGSDAGEAYVSQVFESQYDEYDSAAADDFTLTRSCVIDAVQVPGLYFNGPGLADTETVTFSHDEGGHPGFVISSQTVTGSDDNGTFSIPLAPVSLEAGVRYWVSVQANMSLADHGEWGWEASTIPDGSPAAWENPEDGFGTGCRTWAPLRSCLSAPDGDLMFALEGTMGTSATFAGYEVAVQPNAKTAFKLYRHLPDCTGKPDGATIILTIAFIERGFEEGILWAEYKCEGGVAVWLQTGETTWPSPGQSQNKVFNVKPDPGDNVSLGITQTKGKTRMTVKDLTQGTSDSAAFKGSQLSVLRIGMSAVDSDGNPVYIDGFGSLHLEKIKLNGKPLGAFDPTTVTMLDDSGAPRVAVGALDKKGLDFELDYVG